MGLHSVVVAGGLVAGVLGGLVVLTA